MMPNPHQMSIIPSRDYISEFVAFLAKTPGRDKLCRTIQFSAKIMKYLEETKLADPKKPSANVIMWGSIYTNMSMARKALRFFRTVGVVQSLLKMDPSKSKLDFCKFMANVGLASYFAFDNVSWLKKNGCFDLSADNSLVLDRLTEGSWMIEILFNLPPALDKYQSNAALERKLLKELPVHKADLAKAQAAKLAALMEIIRSVADIPVVLHFLNFTGDIPHGLFGVLGLLSSLIGCWEVWPSP